MAGAAAKQESAGSQRSDEEEEEQQDKGGYHKVGMAVESKSESGGREGLFSFLRLCA